MRDGGVSNSYLQNNNNNSSNSGYHNQSIVTDDENNHNNYDDDDDEDDPTIVSGKKFLVKNDLGPKRISHLQFGLLSAEEIQQLAEFQVYNRDLFTTNGYTTQRKPAIGGCLDPRLGVSDKTSICATCKLRMVDCAGHYGYIKLALPCFHIGYIKHTLVILQCICKSCSRILLVDNEKERFLKQMRSPIVDALQKASIMKRVITRCKKYKICPHCDSINGTVKKITGAPTLKIIHLKYKSGTSTSNSSSGRIGDDEFDILLDQLDVSIRANPEIESMVMTKSSGTTNGGPYEDLLPTRTLELFTRMTDDDCEVLWIDPLIGRPENLIIQNMLVPPVPIRPSVAMDGANSSSGGGGSNEDDLTVKLQEILDVNVALELALSKGPPTQTVIEEWDFLQTLIAQYINGEMPGIQKPIGGMKKPMRGFCQRLKGKQGRFRGNLSGKRVDFSARTVISPDPNLCVDQVGVPLKVAKIMTYPEPVNRYNIERLRQYVRNGPEVHPGANIVRINMKGSFISGIGGNTGGSGDTTNATDILVKSLAFGNRELTARNLRIGDIVERHMIDNDVVLFNRQPSLHKVSIMAHRVKVLEWKTFRFNTCVCAPYNADFDGDEMNMHLPQTEEARAEASLLMGVTNNLITPRNGEPLVAANQDFISASYMLTQQNQFFTYEQFCQLVSYYNDADEQIDIPVPTILKPIKLWTGKQVFSMMLRPNHDSKITVTFETKEKNYSSYNKQFCKNDGWVTFRYGELISGNIAKKSIGDGSKSGLLYTILRDFGPIEASNLLNRWAKFCSRYMGTHRGLSIGISDVTPSTKLSTIKYNILREGYSKVRT
jgi:DNA-directed RNA polymerase III subunit RPC1